MTQRTHTQIGLIIAMKLYINKILQNYDLDISLHLNLEHVSFGIRKEKKTMPPNYYQKHPQRYPPIYHININIFKQKKKHIILEVTDCT